MPGSPSSARHLETVALETPRLAARASKGMNSLRLVGMVPFPSVSLIGGLQGLAGEGAEALVDLRARHRGGDAAQAVGGPHEAAGAPVAVGRKLARGHVVSARARRRTAFAARRIGGVYFGHHTLLSVVTASSWAARGRRVSGSSPSRPYTPS